MASATERVEERARRAVTIKHAHLDAADPVHARAVPLIDEQPTGAGLDAVR
jgi:hypothetical protein